MSLPRYIGRSSITFAILLALCLGLGSAKPANAAAVFEFSLPGNGAVGPFSVQLTFPDFPVPSGLQVYGLTDPVVTSFTSGTTIDPSSSVIGFEVTATTTLIGLSLSDGAASILFTVGYPNDFFVFSRTPTDGGLFSSSSGTVTSSLTLDTATPTGTLQVGDPVPEPATSAIMGLGILGIAVFARKRRSV